MPGNLVVKRLHAFTSGNMGSIPGQGTKILHIMWYSQDKQTNKNSKTKGKKEKKRNDEKQSRKKLNYEQCDEICFMVQHIIYFNEISSGN